MLSYERQDNNRIAITVDSEIYSIKAIYRTAYSFIDRYYIGLDKDENRVLIYLTSKDGTTCSEEVIGEFQNELLHQVIKISVEEETKQVRELIITRALYSAFIPESGETFESDEEFEEESDEDFLDLNDIAKAWTNENDPFTS